MSLNNGVLSERNEVGMGNLSASSNQVRIPEEIAAWIINIAGLNLAVTVDDLKLDREARRLYGSFIVKAEPVCNVVINVRPDMADRQPRPIETRYDGIVFWADSHNFSGKVDASLDSATFSIAPDREALDSVLRVIISVLLTSHNGLLIHASSVSIDGNAFIFPARPEGGKSTIAKLLRGNVVIGDELVAVRRVGDTVSVYGTPFWNTGPGGSPPPVEATAKAICLINKADHVSKRKLAPVEMAAKMMPHIFHDPKNREANRVTLNALAGITEAVSCYDLRFNLDAKDLRRCLNEID